MTDWNEKRIQRHRNKVLTVVKKAFLEHLTRPNSIVDHVEGKGVDNALAKKQRRVTAVIESIGQLGRCAQCVKDRMTMENEGNNISASVAAADHAVVETTQRSFFVPTRRVTGEAVVMCCHSLRASQTLDDLVRSSTLSSNWSVTRIGTGSNSEEVCQTSTLFFHVDFRVDVHWHEELCK